MKKIVFLICLAMAYICLHPILAGQQSIAAEESWKIQFDRLCGRTDNAAEMTVEELKKALTDCDAIKPQIEALEATPRKLYLRRLQMCRNLFAYLLEGKERK